MKYIKLFENYNNIFINFDDDKYTIIWEEDVIPDTEYGVYVDLENDNKYLVLKSDIDKLKDLEKKDRYFDFKGVAVTQEYYSKARKAYSKYKEVKDNADSIRSYDDQYEDPSEWYAYEEYSKYYKKGNWSDLFWNYCL